MFKSFTRTTKRIYGRGKKEEKSKQRIEEWQKKWEANQERMRLSLKERQPKWRYEYRTVDSPERMPAFSSEPGVTDLQRWDEGGWELVSETYVPDLEDARDIQLVDCESDAYWAYVFRRPVNYSQGGMDT